MTAGLRSVTRRLLLSSGLAAVLGARSSDESRNVSGRDGDVNGTAMSLDRWSPCGRSGWLWATSPRAMTVTNSSFRHLSDGSEDCDPSCYEIVMDKYNFWKKEK